MSRIWQMAAEIAEDVFDMPVDYDEGYFICPDCGEPLYDEDWPNWHWEYCPICHFPIDENYYDNDWDDKEDGECPAN